MSYDPGTSYGGGDTASSSDAFPSPTQVTNVDNSISSRLAATPVMVESSGFGDIERTGPFASQVKADSLSNQGGTKTKIVTYSDAIQALYDMTPDQVEQVQRMMYAAGPGVFYPKGYYGKSARPIDWGNPDDAVVGYKNLLKRSKDQRTPSDYLRSYLDDKQKQGQKLWNPDDQGKAATQPFQAVLTNPDDLKAIIQAGAPKVLGKKVSDAEMQDIISKFQTQQISAQRQQFDNNITGGVSDQSANPTDFINSQLRILHPDEALATDFNNQANAFLQGVDQARNHI